MRYIKLNIVAILLCLASAMAVTSCEDEGYDEYDAGATPTAALNGEWWINIADEATGQILIPHALHRTFDANNGKMYISDRFYGDTSPPLTYFGWELIAQVNPDVQNLAFSATDAFNEADESSVTITEGRVFPRGGRSQTGVVTDSIYFKAVFDYDPETVLIFSGHKRTGFIEDEY
ncbi:hypothetical protein CHU92_06050 [Flavobacterium cyanobacteriorum]|uniref:Lipid-binding hydrolase n=1 Tax=Flavobacterium cyanobacteriorum TaxID=2022802 RepID=A0A255ZC97_9FLAO|nr:lipid-binding protein [Flavobacterium cyanobacteriorum]OYQ38230.1 hypothetical protein CHU92_06050 [Flavobacterium cyanobacteriorum]